MKLSFRHCVKLHCSNREKHTIIIGTAAAAAVVELDRDTAAAAAAVVDPTDTHSVVEAKAPRTATVHDPMFDRAAAAAE
jgi:hypothetical protein